MKTFIAFILAFAFGALQVFLLDKLLKSVTSGNNKKVLLFFLIKFLTYGIAIAFVMFKCMFYITQCLCGFVAGMPLFGAFVFIYRSFLKDKINFKYRRRRKKPSSRKRRR